MVKTRRVINATILAGISLASIVVGFWLFRFLGASHQLAIQMPSALLTGASGMVLWLRGFRRLHGLDPSTDYVPTLLLGFPICAILVVAGHYLVTGYLTAFGNVAGAWFVMFAEFVLAAPLAARGSRREERPV